MSKPPATPNVVELDPHDAMTPEEALAKAARSGFEQVLICGYVGNEFTVMGSNMPREAALWLVEHLKLHVIDRLDR